MYDFPFSVTQSLALWRTDAQTPQWLFMWELEAAEAAEKLIRSHGFVVHVAVPGAMETGRK